jgi:hypothetical protein
VELATKGEGYFNLSGVFVLLEAHERPKVKTC